MATMPAQCPGRSKQDYATPQALLGAVKRRLRITTFTFDFAADIYNTVADRYFTKENDALSELHWEREVHGGWGWLNPPYADIAPWATKCWQTKRDGGRVALLVPAAVGSNWFRDYVDRKALVLFLNGRLCFIKDWQTTIDPATLKPGKGPPRFYRSAPLYPKDCLLAMYSPWVDPGYEVWNWRESR